MKKATCPASFIFLAFVMTFSLLSCGGGDDGGTPEIVRYVVTDLQGTWYLNTVNTNNTGGAADSYYGQMVVTSGGNIVGGQYEFYPTGDLAFAGGLLQLTQDTGALSGTVNTASFNYIIDSGKMAPSKTAMIFNSHKGPSTTEFDLTIAFKGGGSYLSSDIAGRVGPGNYMSEIQCQGTTTLCPTVRKASAKKGRMQYAPAVDQIFAPASPPFSTACKP